MNKFMGLAVIILLCFSLNFMVEGREVIDFVPVVERIEDNDMVELRSLSEEFGWQLIFLSQEKSVVIKGNGGTLELGIDKEEFAGSKLDNKPLIQEGRTYIDFETVSILFEEMEVDNPPEFASYMVLEETDGERGSNFTGEINLFNFTGEEQVLNFSSGQKYDLFLLKDGKEVWRWSEGKMFTMALVEKKILPDERLKLPFDFEISEDLVSGDYILKGVITAVEGFEAGSREIKIK